MSVPLPLGVECEKGNHAACWNQAWDYLNDEPTYCRCSCHRPPARSEEKAAPMTRYACNRSKCDWKPSDDDEISEAGQLAEHAAEAGHWLCRCCWLSLSDEQYDWFGCESCLTEARTLLSGIVTLWADLPRHIGHLGSPNYDSDRPSAKDGPPLPGGEALVLLGPGDYGGVARRLTATEAAAPERWWLKGAVGPLTQAGVMQAERERTGREHHADNRLTDPSPVAFVLMQHEDEWRTERHEPPAQVAGSPSRVLHAAARYLDTFTRWAAQNYDGFPDYLSELKALHYRLEVATSTHKREIRSDVGCLKCGTALVRKDRPVKPCDHEPPRPQPEHLWFEDDEGKGKWVRVRTAAQVQAEHEAALEAWTAEHLACDQGGLADEYVCPVRKCGEKYDTHRFALAATEGERDRLREHWVTPEQAETLLGVKPDTVRKWHKRGIIEGSRTVSSDGLLRVRYADVETRSQEREAS